MELYKGSKINAIINEKGVNLGYINLNLYTMDNSTSVIDIHLKMKNVLSEKQEYFPINLNQTEFEPVLHLFAQDGSIFTNEKLEIVKAEEGYVRYYIPDYVTRHIGQVKEKLFLEDTSGSDDSSHVADFYFVVNDSGITKAVGKEIHVELLNDIVEKIMKDNLELFKGDKGDKGEPGKDGVDGKDGKDGVDGVNGSTGPQGPPGLNGVDGKSFTYEDFTPEQLENLKPKLPNFDNWQKAKLTGDDGYIKTIYSSVDMSTMADPSFNVSGFNYYSNLSNTPDNRSKFGYINVLLQGLTSGYAIYREYNSNTFYINYKYGSVWKGWSALNPDYSKTLNWQKIKLTSDDGANFYDPNLKIDFSNSDQLLSLPIGTRYVVNSTNQPYNTSTSGWFTKLQRTNDVVLIKYQPYNSNVIYQKRFYKIWSDWEQVGLYITDSGWLSLPLSNGAKSYRYDEDYFLPSYRFVDNGKSKFAEIQGCFTNLTKGSVFSKIPINIAPQQSLEFKIMQRDSSDQVLAYLNSSGELKVVGTPKSDANYLINLTWIV